MNLPFTEVLVAALAVWQAVEVWRHSSLFATWRARTELWEGKAGEVLGCPFCLSNWGAAAACLVVLLTPSPLPTWSQLGSGLLGFLLAVTTLSAARAMYNGVGWMNDFYHSTPNRWVARLAAATYGVLIAGSFVFVCWLFSSLDGGDAWRGVWFLAVGPFKLAVYALAVARLANLGNDLAYGWNRTPKDDKPDVVKSTFEEKPKYERPVGNEYDAPASLPSSDQRSRTSTNSTGADDRLPFDEAVCAEIVDRFRSVLLTHPEVVCLSAAVTYRGPLNSAQINSGVWIGQNGPANTGPEIVGSIWATLRLLGTQLDRAAAYVTQLDSRVASLLAEAARLHEEVQRLEEKARLPFPDA